jgi:hypothetical protein
VGTHLGLFLSFNPLEQKTRLYIAAYIIPWRRDVRSGEVDSALGGQAAAEAVDCLS